MAALAATLKTALTLKQKMQQENNYRYRAADYDVPLRKNAKQSVNRKKETIGVERLYLQIKNFGYAFKLEIA